MVKVKYSGRYPGYLEGFPKDCKRSCKGALHLQPGSIKEITEEEWDFIKESHSKLPIEKLDQPKLAVKAQAKAEESVKVSVKKTKVKRSK